MPLRLQRSTLKILRDGYACVNLSFAEEKGTEFRQGMAGGLLQELFGYERPKPPVHWQDRGPYESSAPDSFEQQEYYPAPWPYMPGQPAWGGGGYPYQYGPYGSYRALSGLLACQTGRLIAHTGMAQDIDFRDFQFSPT